MALRAGWRIEGDELFIANLKRIVDARIVEEIVRQGAGELRDEARRHAPRDTGLLEDEIAVLSTTRDSKSVVAEVGVERSSPAYERFLATEFWMPDERGATPENPDDEWPEKSKAGATMPFLRSSAHKMRSVFFQKLRAALFARFL